MDPYKIINKYYSADTELYRILTVHSEQVKMKALSVAQKHLDLKLDLQFLEEASLLHDIGIFMCDAPRIQCFGSHKYIEHGYLGADLLREEGLEKHALVCERHTGVGLTRDMIEMGSLPLPDRDLFPVSLEEIVICYADKFYSKTRLNEEHSVDKIIADLKRFGTEQSDKFISWHERFG